MSQPAISVEGLKEVIRDFKRVGDVELPKELKALHKDLSSKVASRASANAPVKTGKLKATIRGLGSQRYGVVKEGKASIPYAGWVDFGGNKRGRGGGIQSRPYLSNGRIIYPALDELKPTIEREYNNALEKVLRRL